MFGSIDALLKLRKAWDEFSANHPGVAGFSREVSAREISEGTLIDLKLTYPDGETLSTNMKVGAEDLMLLNELKALTGKKK